MRTYVVISYSLIGFSVSHLIFQRLAEIINLLYLSHFKFRLLQLLDMKIKHENHSYRNASHNNGRKVWFTTQSRILIPEYATVSSHWICSRHKAIVMQVIGPQVVRIQGSKTMLVVRIQGSKTMF